MFMYYTQIVNKVHFMRIINYKQWTKNTNFEVRGEVINIFK